MQKLLFAFAAACGCLGAAAQPGTFSNPVIPGDLPDPSVIRVGETYYACGTSSEWAPFYPLFTSRDLVNWTQAGHLFEEQPEWTRSSFWAPELFHRDGRTYAYYTARRKSDGTSYIGVATADRPEGPYTDHGPVVALGTEAIDAELEGLINGLTAKVTADMDNLTIPQALMEIFTVIQRANKYIDETAPWALAKDEANKARLESVLYHLCEALRVCGILLNAYLPTTAPKMMEQLGLDASALDLTKTTYGAQQTYTVHKGEALFPRIDVAKEIAHLKEEDEKRKAAAAAANKAKEEAEKKAAAPAEESTVDFTHEEEIDFDTFCKVELRVAEVRACENLKESKKLLHLTVFDGERERCILSGIAKWFKPEDLIGKKLGIVCNLAPRPMLKGKYVSEGMIFAADTADGGCSIAFYGDDTPVGSRIH